MADTSPSLMSVYRGWDGYQTSLLNALKPRTVEELAFRSAPDLQSVGEIFRHLSLGRLNWFVRMNAPGSAELATQIPEWVYDKDGNRHIVDEAIPTDSASLIHWLEATWRMIEATLTTWNVEDLEKTYRHTFRGTTYTVSRQWTIWRIQSHDIHHGGQLSMLLFQQGIELLELGYLGGHLTEPPVADPVESAPVP